MQSKILEIVRQDSRIQPGLYSGYVLWTMISMVALSVLTIFFANVIEFDAIQQVMVFGAMALSFDYFSGYTGYYNLGFGAQLAVGGYMFVYATNAGLNLFLAFILAGVASVALSFVTSYPVLRLRGGYFAIGTLALVILLYMFDVNLPEYTGGQIGFHVDASTPQIALPLFIGSTIFVMVALLVHLAIGRSKLGLTLRSIREDESVTQSMGVNTFRAKQITFCLSGFFAGLSGGIYALYIGYVSVQNLLGLGTGLLPVTAAVIGGAGIFIGPLVGVILLTGLKLTLPSAVTAVFPNVSFGPLVYIGLLLVIAGLFFPQGLLQVRFLRRFAGSRPDRMLTRRRGKISTAPPSRTNDPPAGSSHPEVGFHHVAVLAQFGRGAVVDNPSVLQNVDL